MSTPSDSNRRYSPAASWQDHQNRQALSFLRFKSHDQDADQAQILARAARILRAGRDAALNERVWGLAAGETDYSDVARSFDEWAVNIHQPAHHAAEDTLVADDVSPPGARTGGRHAAS